MRGLVSPAAKAGGLSMGMPRCPQVEAPPMSCRSALVFLGFGVLVAGGCAPKRPTPAPVAAAKVPVSRPVQRMVTETVDYTGRLDAVESVGVRARVTGYLTRTPFKEGAEVAKGDLLFEVDPRPYEAQLEQAESQVGVAEAQLALAKSTLGRTRASAGAVSPQEVDQAKSSADSAEAQVRAAKATAEANRLNLEYTKVHSPIAGQVSRYYYTAGNLVSQDQTLLTTVVSVDPMYVYFDMDERTLLRVVAAINAERAVPPSAGTAPVTLGLDGEEGYPHAGALNFLNNVVNPATGTVAIRGVFANPKPKDGRRLFKPGMFARVRMPIGSPRPALLVIDRAVGSDQGLKYVYVLDAEGKVQYRRVTTGALEDDGLRVIESGLKPEDKVVVGALQQLRPKAQVETEDVPMPTGGPRPAAEPGRG